MTEEEITGGGGERICHDVITMLLSFACSLLAFPKIAFAVHGTI